MHSNLEILDSEMLRTIGWITLYFQGFLFWNIASDDTKGAVFSILGVWSDNAYRSVREGAKLLNCNENSLPRTI